MQTLRKLEHSKKTHSRVHGCVCHLDLGQAVTSLSYYADKYWKRVEPNIYYCRLDCAFPNGIIGSHAPTNVESLCDAVLIASN